MHWGCAQPVGVERRTLHNIRKVIDNAPLIQRASLRYMARKIGVEGLRELDSNLSDQSFVNSLEPRPGKRVLHYLRQVVNEAENISGNAMKFMTRRLGVEGLRDLDKVISKLRVNPDKVKV